MLHQVVFSLQASEEAVAVAVHMTTIKTHQELLLVEEVVVVQVYRPVQVEQRVLVEQKVAPEEQVQQLLLVLVEVVEIMMETQ